MAQPHHLQSVLAALAVEPETLDRARERFSDSPPSYRSHESTELPTPTTPGVAARQLERDIWERVQRHRASLPLRQFADQAQVEYERLKQHSEWRGKPVPDDMDLYSFAETAIMEDWKRQGICRREWCDDRRKMDRWKHEYPLDLDDEFSSDTEETLHPENTGARTAIQTAETKAAAKNESPPPRNHTIRRHNHEMSRPYHQFMWQVAVERQFLIYHWSHPGPRWTLNDADETVLNTRVWRSSEDQSKLPPDLNSRAYANVMNTWMDQGLFLTAWGEDLPGFTWLHEEPLSKYVSEELGEEAQAPSTVFQGGPITQEYIELHRRSRREYVVEQRRKALIKQRTKLLGAPDLLAGRPAAQTAARYDASHPGEASNADRHGTSDSLGDTTIERDQAPISPNAPQQSIWQQQQQRQRQQQQQLQQQQQQQEQEEDQEQHHIDSIPSPQQRPWYLSTIYEPREQISEQSQLPLEPTETRNSPPPQPDIFPPEARTPRSVEPSPPPQATEQPSLYFSARDQAPAEQANPTTRLSTRSSSPAESASSYKTGNSISSNTSNSRQKRPSETPEPEIDTERPAKSRRRRTSSSREQANAETQTSLAFSSKRQPAQPSVEEQPKQKRRQQAARASTSGAAAKNGQTAAPSGTDSPTQPRRSTRLQKMKDEGQDQEQDQDQEQPQKKKAKSTAKANGKGKGKAKARGKGKAKKK